MTLIFSALACLSLLTTPSDAHSWYDETCCDERDCQPIAGHKVVRDALPDGTLGWRVYHRFLPEEGSFIADDDAVVLSDGEGRLRETPRAVEQPYHACIIPSSVHGSAYVRCLYIRQTLL